jgi:hypothetical protein
MAVDWDKPVQVRVFNSRGNANWIAADSVIPVDRGGGVMPGRYALVDWHLNGVRMVQLFEGNDEGVRNTTAEEVWIGIVERKDQAIRVIYGNSKQSVYRDYHAAWEPTGANLLCVKLVFERAAG